MIRLRGLCYCITAGDADDSMTASSLHRLAHVTSPASTMLVRLEVCPSHPVVPVHPAFQTGSSQSGVSSFLPLCWRGISLAEESTSLRMLLQPSSMHHAGRWYDHRRAACCCKKNHLESNLHHCQPCPWWHSREHLHKQAAHPQQ